MFNNSIRSQVMRQLNEIVDVAQEKYEAVCAQIDARAEQEKVDAKEAAVQSIIGKFI